MVTPEYFSTLGVTAMVGRVLAPTYQTGAVLSYGFWQRRLAGDPAAVGRVIHLHGHPFPVVGVLPKDFSGFSIDSSPEVRVPLVAASLLEGGGADPDYHRQSLSRPGRSPAAWCERGASDRRVSGRVARRHRS